MFKIFILIETDFILTEFNTSKASNGSVIWKTPSNIALVKYWGKQEPQLPENASISFTLDACFTLTALEYNLKTNRHSELDSESYDENLKQVKVDVITRLSAPATPYKTHQILILKLKF